MANILIVDDDASFCRALEAVISDLGFGVSIANTLEAGLRMARQDRCDVVVLDVVLPDGNGLDAIAEFRESPGGPEIIILTGSGDPDGAELAIKSGAWDYIAKPPTMNKIRLPVSRAVEYHLQKTTRKPLDDFRREAIIGGSKAIETCLATIAKAAKSSSSVLIFGETGTGKELFARAIHENSSRSQGPFVVVDCAALPENLVESMLFGHEKGAFTTADKKHVGLVQQAHGGVLFLDEVGELPLTVQKAFLRVLQEHRFRPVGATREEQSDFRVVAATNRDLDRMVADWQFRQDLLFRLRAMSVDLPPLRDRAGDIEALARHFLAQHAAQNGDAAREVSPDFWGALLAYHWPGNVRELFNALENAVASAGSDPILYSRHLPINIRASVARLSMGEGAAGLSLDSMSEVIAHDPDRFPTIKDFRSEALGRLERRYLQELLKLSRGKIQRACTLSGLSRARLYAILKRHGVDR